MDIPVYFLHNGEDNMEENWFRLNQKTRHAREVQAVGNIFESHKHIASLCETDRFYVVDADCWIVDSFNFDRTIDLKPKSVAVFRAKNPINGLVYGHGGIKLFSKDCFSAERLDRPDMTTTLADTYIKVNVLASEHRFNYNPYATWRTAFREAVKLSAGVNKNNNDQESKDRLAMWCEAGIEAVNGYFSIQGAREGVAYTERQNADFNLVNDFAWLEKRFFQWIGVAHNYGWLEKRFKDWVGV
jgi:hypothetical protein